MFFLAPEAYLSLARDRQREMIAEVENDRLLTAARRARRDRRRARRAAPANAEVSPVGAEAPAGTVAPCGPRVAAPAR